MSADVTERLPCFLAADILFLLHAMFSAMGSWPSLLVLSGLLSSVIPLSNVAAVGQSIGAKDAALPTNPDKLLLLAAHENSLDGDDLKPWQLKVSYKFLDSSGTTTDHGTIEERWAGPKLRKLDITTATSRLTYVRTDKGDYREGSLNQKLALLLLLEESFTKPIPISAQSLNYLEFNFRRRPIQGSLLPCYSFKEDYHLPISFNDPAYCLESKSAILRIGSFSNDTHQFVRNNIAKFQGRFVPIDISAGEEETPDLVAHLDSLKQIATVDLAEFKPAPDALLEIPSQGTMYLAEGTFEKFIEKNHLHPISRPAPEYPAAAEAAHVHGTVELRARIGTDGQVHSLHVIKGPALLQQAALDAVWRWRFEPYVWTKGNWEVLAYIDVHF